MKIYHWSRLSELNRKNLLLRPLQDENIRIRDKTKAIVEQVKLGGDQALFALTLKYDKTSLAQFLVNKDEIKRANQQIDQTAKNAIKFSKKQIEKNHKIQFPKKQNIKTCEGVLCERVARAIDSVGLYIPGGSAPLVSTVLMLAVPAKIANCKLRILCTPPNVNGEIDPHIIYAATICDIQAIYKLGGAQAIAAMAYGTETIPKVNKIFGPGNSWVTLAKMLVANDPKGASIDMPAGPSELLVIADDDANCEFVAADLLSQAEHGIDSQVLLIAFSEEFALKVKRSMLNQLKHLPRRNIIKQALSQSRMIVVNNIKQALIISNSYAPEHLILQVNNPTRYKAAIKNAGAVFFGPYAPETAGDYVTGSNHVLPTYGFAQKISGLSVIDFMKYISFQTITSAGIKKIGPFAEQLAEIEGLHAHKQAIALRLQEGLL